MENDRVNILLEDCQKEVRILHGQTEAPVVHTSVNVNGSIDAPLKYLQVRDPELKESHIQVDRDTMVIRLTVNEHLKDADIITGALKFTEEFKEWQINTGEAWTSRALAQFIKMNRSAFSTKDVAMKLSDQLQNMKVKVEKIVEDKNDNRGNAKLLRQQAVKDLNIPESFVIEIQVFKGGSKVVLSVEIYINADDFTCTLVSPDAADAIRKTRDEEIDKVIDQIRELKPQLAIMEV
jgi:hypothetical protein